MAAPHNDNIKEKILQSATKLLYEKSFNEITLSEIAKKANVTKGSIYYYYKNKDDILYDIADGYLELLYHDLMIWIDNKEKDTSLPRMISYALKRGVNDPGKGIRLHLTVEAIAGNEKIRLKLLERYQTFRQVFAEKVREQKPETNSQFYGFLILTLVDGLIVQTLLGSEGLDIDEFVDEIVKVFG